MKVNLNKIVFILTFWALANTALAQNLAFITNQLEDTVSVIDTSSLNRL